MKITIEELKKIMPNMHVKIITLCNFEERYKPGNTGVVSYVDDAGQVHVSWNHGGTIALLPLEGDKFEYWMPNEAIMKKVRENFKKKRGHWDIKVGTFYDFETAYRESQRVFQYLDSQFNEDEKDKYMYNKVKIGVTPKDSTYEVSITFKR